MADKQFIDLPNDTNIDGTEVIPLQEAAGGAGSTKEVTAAQMAAFSTNPPAIGTIIQNAPQGPGNWSDDRNKIAIFDREQGMANTTGAALLAGLSWALPGVAAENRGDMVLLGGGPGASPDPRAGNTLTTADLLTWLQAQSGWPGDPQPDHVLTVNSALAVDVPGVKWSTVQAALAWYDANADGALYVLNIMPGTYTGAGISLANDMTTTRYIAIVGAGKENTRLEFELSTIFTFNGGALLMRDLSILDLNGDSQGSAQVVENCILTTYAVGGFGGQGIDLVMTDCTIGAMRKRGGSITADRCSIVSILSEGTNYGGVWSFKNCHNIPIDRHINDITLNIYPDCTGITYTNGGGGCVVNFISSQYSPGDETKWTDPDPVTFKAAIDRMAALLVTLNSGNPIP